MVKERSEISYTSKVYTYPDGSQDIIVADSPIFRSSGWEAVDRFPRPISTDSSESVDMADTTDVVSELLDRKKRESGSKSAGEDMLRSMRRARAKLRRLALANSFELFCTLTLDPERIQRYDPVEVAKKLNQWARNMVQRHGMKYILVPERHKDGAFHFHGFLAGDIRLKEAPVEWDGRKVYNLPQWKLGFSTAQFLYGDYQQAVGYCCKYIGKQEDQRPLGRWYYSGGGLVEPEVSYHNLEIRDFEGFQIEIPGISILKISNNTNQKVEV